MAGLGTTLSPASADLGLGKALSDQVKEETEDERRKRLMASKGAQLSPGAMSLLGPGMGLNSGGF